MLSIALFVLSAAASLGAILAVLHGRTERPGPDWRLGALHGVIGLLGLGVLVLALAVLPRAGPVGAAQFGRIAAGFFACTLLTGLAPLVARIRRRPLPVLVLGLHATFAITGLVVLLAYL